MGSASTLLLFARLILSLGVVIGLMWVAANVLRKRGFTGVAGRGNSRGPQVELVARRPLGRNSSIAVVRIGDRSIVVGVTEHQITNLGEIDSIDLDDISVNEDNTWTGSSTARGAGSAWTTMLEQMRKRTTRR